MANGKKIHGVVVETFQAVREYATRLGLSMSSFRDFENCLGLMEKDDKHLDSLEKMAIPGNENSPDYLEAMKHLVAIGKQEKALGSDHVSARAHLYNLADHAVTEVYGCESENVQAAKCGQ